MSTITYFANPVRAAREAMLNGALGYIDTPLQGNARPPGVSWCADNGAFSDKWNADQWERWLRKNATAGASCTFAVAPDVVADAQATLQRSRPWLAVIREMGYPVAFVAQDGIEDTAVPWDGIDALFIGGSTQFKLGATAAHYAVEAKDRGKWVHMGRVNSLRRLRYAASIGLPVGRPDIGCDSVDGTYLVFGPETNLPKLLGWLAEVNGQPPLGSAA